MHHHCHHGMEDWEEEGYGEHHHHGCYGKMGMHEEEEGGCEITEKLMFIADIAWKKLMIEKLKAEIDKTHGDKLNNLAKLIADTGMQKWMLFMQMKQKKEEFQDQLKQMMSQMKS